MVQQVNTTTRPLLQRPTTWVGAFLLLFIAGLGLLALRELKAKREVDAMIAELRNQGIPVDNQTMEANFASTTSKENSALLSEVRSEANNDWVGTLGADLPEVGTGELPASALSGEAWPDEPLVAEYLEKLRPTLDKLHSLSNVTIPIWQPIHFNGFGTLLGPLQESRSLSRLLALDFDHALFHKDHQRAIANLRSMRSAAEAFRWENCLVTDLVYVAMTGYHRQMIKRSLQVDFWTLEELAEIRDIVGESRDIAKAWPKLMACERAMALASVRSRDVLSYSSKPGFLTAVYSLPSIQRGYLNDVEKLISIGAGGLEQLSSRSAQAINLKEINLLSAEVLPATEALAEAYVRSEETRRITLLSLAVKHFRLSNQRLPNSLAELQEAGTLGISSRELKTVDGRSFGFSLEGQTVYIWNTRSSHPMSNPILTQRPPEFNSVTGQSKESREVGEVVTIR